MRIKIFSLLTKMGDKHLMVFQRLCQLHSVELDDERAHDVGYCAQRLMSVEIHPEKTSVPDLRSVLDYHGVAYGPRAKKDELVALYRQYRMTRTIEEVEIEDGSSSESEEWDDDSDDSEETDRGEATEDEEIVVIEQPSLSSCSLGSGTKRLAPKKESSWFY